MAAFRTLDSLSDLTGQTALVRVDFNVPMEDGKITDDTRLRAALPTINFLRERGAKVALIAHFDRPKGKRVPSMSLSPIVEPLSKLLGAPVAFAEDCIGEVAQTAIEALKPGQVILLENLRFHKGEEDNDPAFAAELAELAHEEVGARAERLRGSKVSTKLDLLKNLVGKLDKLAIGGGMANTFLFAQGHDIGASLCEKEMAETAREILTEAKARNCEILLPIDLVCAKDLKPGAETHIRSLGQVEADEKIFDAGPKSIARLTAAFDVAATVIWNGPLGVFEVPPFDAGTVTVARHAAALAKSGSIIAVAGGGDTVAALNHAGVAADFTFVSTAGGAFLEWMEGKALPGVEALKIR